MTIIKFSDSESVNCYTPREVADMLVDCCDLNLDADERISEVRLECGSDLEIDIEKVVEDDPRCTGYHSHTETYTILDLRTAFTEADFCIWAKDENDEDTLVCFN